MEESWQIKCSSTMQSSIPSVASSSSSLELRNQTEKNTSYYSYPHDPRDLRRKVLGPMQGPMFPNYPNLSSQKSSHVSLGNSFLALLSGPPSVLPCDFKEFPNSKLTIDSNSVVVNAVGGGAMLKFNGLPSLYPSEQNLQLGADSRFSVSTRGMSGSNCSSNSVLPGLPGSEMETTFTHRMVTGSEKAKSSFSLNAELHNAVPSNAGKVCSTKVQVSSVEENSSHSPSFLSNCPRVFCLGVGGYLLISNTGLLGIVCSCHYLHMSVLKFCEHSGLCGGNIGDSVRMESGETIAIWRKLYFQKFGIRIPEDQSDWDWPEGVTATSGLVKSRTSLPNSSCNFSHLVSSSEGLSRSVQIPDNAMFSSLNTNQNLVSKASQDKQKRNAQDGNNAPLNSLIGTSQGKMHAVADTQIMEHPLSGFSTVSKSIGSGSKDGYRSTTSCTESILKNGGSSITCPSPVMQDFRTIGQKSNFSMFRNAQATVFVGGDAVFSNIELKLGQPYQSSQNFKTSDRPASDTQLLDTFVNPSKLIFPEQITTNAADCHQGKVEHGQPIYCAAGSCGPNTKREESQLNLGNNGFEISNVNNAAKLEKSRVNLTQNAVVSLLSNFNLLSEDSGRIKPNNNMFNCTEQTIPPHLHHYESRMARCGSSYAPWNSANGLERQLTVAEMGSHGLTDKGKGLKFAADGSYFMKDSESRIHKEAQTSTSYPFLSAAQGSSCELYQLPSAPMEPLETRTFSTYPVNMRSSGSNLQVDHVNHRSLTSSFGSGLILPSQVVTKGLPLASSTCLLDQIPALHREEGNCLSPCPLDDNLKILALRQILELSKQQHTFSSFGMNRWEGRCDGNSHFHHSVAESSARGEQCNGPSLANSREVTEVAARVAARAHLVGPTNTNGCSDLSTLIRGIPIHSTEIDVQGQLSNDPLQNEHPSMSQCQKNISRPSEHEKCCGAPSVCFQHSCNCSVHRNCSKMNLESNVQSLPNALKEKRGTVNDEASVKFGSKFCQNHLIPNDKILSVDQEAKSNGKLSKNIVNNTSQWRDVPTKVKGISKVTRTDMDTSAKCINGTMQIRHAHKEHENSNMSFESSAPAVTQLSVEVSNVDSSNADAVNAGCVNNLVVDEGSGIDKCWSSDDVHGSERSAEFLGDSWKASSKDSGSSLDAHHQSSRSLMDELKLINSLTWKKGHKQIQTEMILQNKDNPRRIFGARFSQHRSSEHRLSIFSSTKKPIRKRDVHKLYNDKEGKDVCWTDSKAGAGNHGIPEVSAQKKYKKDCSIASRQSLTEEEIHSGTRTMKKSKLLGCTKSSFTLETNDYSCKWRPIVCGNFGELSNGDFAGDMEKPAKIVPLNRVLKSARRCAVPKKGKFITSMKLKNTNTVRAKECDKGFQCSNTKNENRSHCAAAYGKTDNETSLENNRISTKDNCSEELPILKVERQQRSKKDSREEDNIANGQLKSKIKEIRKRSIYELTVDRKGLQQKTSSISEISKGLPEMTEGNILRNGDDRKNEFCEVDEKSPQGQTCSSLLDSDSFCCVCGSSNKDETNYLLECKRCLIRVHQACYGVSRAPKGHWYCRPCRTSSRNIVCVLCGYGGGAMTQALRSRTMVKSLLRAWNIEAQCKVKNMLPVKTLEDSPSGLNCSGSGCEGGASVTLFQHEITRPIASAVCNMGNLDVLQNSPGASKLKMDNSITAGLLDSTTKQWVHMVCGLWTPGTRCPNVYTMSAFDVSGAPRPRADVVCSICSRPGGSCIKCRVLNCFVPFHPWCAHQKGLLQSEIEGVDNENVGFYGRCLLHATHPMCESVSDPVDGVNGVSGIEEITCARTEGYKGRKRDGFWHNYYNQSRGKVGCHVPQEQLNAWIHINGQKACIIPALPKLPLSDIENDCRKEYARYKQGRRWKHLVVYKSGIHALGLYTSRFISRGEMVVEYVGEIVGQRVSDKRESEYQSGRKLQYKSACYFFRIDKEHIIDATCRGGIARFVNHSCLPNCVAKVISIRNEKKVVFFAERDIFPGEEITYDYHFNHEDEGKKIPCFCNSKNCRRYLN